MRELFARWAKPKPELSNEIIIVTHVTQPSGFGLQEYPSKINDVTHVTRVTQKKYQSENYAGQGPADAEVFSDLLKNRVTRVTRVTDAISLDNSCNPTCNPRVTRVTFPESLDNYCSPLLWPDELRENFEERAAIMEFDGGLTRQEAEQQAAEIVKAAHTGRLPAHLEPGAQAMAGRLVAGGWTPSQAAELARSILADRHRLN